ncbi:MAG: GntR family transcriptional regulator [Pseudomonadota bacterium]|nr:GntR family transcriptional regulator [Pseudomonadota bacterium]
MDRRDETTGHVAGPDRQGETGPAVTDAATLSARAAQAIEADILAGRLAPDARLGIAETAARYGVGATPLREALSRLAARGLVHARGNRGFRVTPISRADLADIVLIRGVIEREALRLAMARGDAEWEAAILAALHRLRRHVGDDPRGFREGDAAFDALHKAFHAALIAACGSPRLLAAQAQLYDEAYRYRRLMMANFPSPDAFLTGHERLARLVIARQDAACAALGEHIASTLTLVYPARERVS